MGNSMSIAREPPAAEALTMNQAKEHVLSELRGKIGGDCRLQMDVLGEAGEYGEGLYHAEARQLRSADDLASSLENDWFAVKLSSDLDEEWLFVEYRAEAENDSCELDSSDDESEGETIGEKLEIPDFSRSDSDFKHSPMPGEEGGASQLGWLSSAMSLVSSISFRNPAKNQMDNDKKKDSAKPESEMEQMRRSVLAMEAQLQALQAETASLRSSVLGSMMYVPPSTIGSAAFQQEGDLTFEAAPPPPPMAGPPPPPPPPLPQSGKLPVKKKITVTKAVVRKKRTRKDVRKDLHDLITRSDLTPVNYEKAYQNFLDCFRNDLKLRKLDRLVRLYGDLVKTLPTKPKTCFMKMCLWERELFHKLDDKVARKWRASKMKKIIDLEAREDVLAEISLVQKALEYERKQAKVAAATKNAGRNRNSMMLELSGILSSKQDAEAQQQAQAELEAMEQTPIGEDELDGEVCLVQTTTVSI